MTTPVAEAVVSVFGDGFSPTSPRSQRYVSAKFRTYRPERWGHGSTWVDSIELREDGWLVVNLTGYADTDLELFPPTSISLLVVPPAPKEPET